MNDTSTAYQLGVALGGLIAIALIFATPLAFIASLIFFIRSKRKAWLFLVIPSGILSFVLVGGFMVALGRGMMEGLESNRQKNTEHVVPADRLVRSEDSLLAITLPKNWAVLKNLNDEAQLQAGAPKREEYLIVINETKADFAGSLQEYADAVISGLEGNLIEPKATKLGGLKVDGREALQYEVSGSVDRLNVIYLVTLIESDEHFHQITQWTLPSKRSTAEPVFREVIQSVSLKGEGKEG